MTDLSIRIPDNEESDSFQNIWNPFPSRREWFLLALEAKKNC
jgi:hypothetical protein